jgi:hypothetical protein
MIFGNLSSKLGPEDMFFLYMEGTPMAIPGSAASSVRIGGNMISSADMERYISSLGHGKGLLVYGPGMENFVDSTGKGSNLALSAGACGDLDGTYNMFSASLMEGLSPKKKGIIDADGNGKRSLPDAIYYAEGVCEAGHKIHVKTGFNNLDDISLGE